MSTVGGTDRDDPTGKAKKAERKRKGIELTDLLMAATEKETGENRTTNLQDADRKERKKKDISVKDKASIMGKVGWGGGGGRGKEERENARVKSSKAKQVRLQREGAGKVRDCDKFSRRRSVVGWLELACSGLAFWFWTPSVS